MHGRAGWKAAAKPEDVVLVLLIVKYHGLRVPTPGNINSKTQGQIDGLVLTWVGALFGYTHMTYAYSAEKVVLVSNREPRPLKVVSFPQKHTSKQPKTAQKQHKKQDD